MISLYHAFQKDDHWSTHPQDQMEIVFCFARTICNIYWHLAGRERHELEIHGPRVFIIGPDVQCDCRFRGEVEFFVLYIKPSFLQIVGGRRFEGIVFYDLACNDPVVSLLISVLRLICMGRRRPCGRTIDAIGGELAFRFVEQVNNAAVVYAGRRLSPGQLMRLMQYIELNMKHDIHVVDLAKQVGLRVSHFTKLFTGTIGCSPYRYIKEIRLLKSYEMLLTGDYLAKDVALAVGYINADHFSGVFRDRFGCSPFELIKEVRGTSEKTRFRA